MTKTYLVHAWCIRPFITCIDIDADRPQEAVANARRESAKLLDAAEECNHYYSWDEFAVYDDSGNELLHVLDREARLREAAPACRVALARLVDAAADLDAAIDGVADQFDDERAALQTALAKALAALTELKGNAT